MAVVDYFLSKATKAPGQHPWGFAKRQIDHPNSGEGERPP
jgi:hypothetical protein